jgi:hypothetical protein
VATIGAGCGDDRGDGARAVGLLVGSEEGDGDDDHDEGVDGYDDDDDGTVRRHDGDDTEG